MAFVSNPPEATGDLKKDYENLFDYVVILNKNLGHQLSHIDNSNTVVGTLSLNSDFIWVNIRGGKYLG